MFDHMLAELVTEHSKIMLHADEDVVILWGQQLAPLRKESDGSAGGGPGDCRAECNGPGAPVGQRLELRRHHDLTGVANRGKKDGPGKLLKNLKVVGHECLLPYFIHYTETQLDYLVRVGVAPSLARNIARNPLNNCGIVGDAADDSGAHACDLATEGYAR